MENYNEVRVKLTSTQINKLVYVAKSNTGTTLRVTKKNLQDDELLDELFQTTRQKTKVRNDITNNMSTGRKFSKSQLAKIIQSGGFLRKTGNLGKKKVLLDLAVLLAKDVLPKLATKATLSLLDKFERKISGKGAVRPGRGFNLFIPNEDMDDIIKIVETVEKSELSVDSVTETIKHEIKKQEGRFLGAMMAPMAPSLKALVTFLLIQPVISSLINAISRKGVTEQERDNKVEFFCYQHYL